MIEIDYRSREMKDNKLIEFCRRKEMHPEICYWGNKQTQFPVE
jgi:hypothetical protein